MPNLVSMLFLQVEVLSFNLFLMPKLLSMLFLQVQM